MEYNGPMPCSRRAPHRPEREKPQSSVPAGWGALVCTAKISGPLTCVISYNSKLGLGCFLVVSQDTKLENILY